MDSTKAFVREHGYVETIFGRRIHIRDVKAQSARIAPSANARRSTPHPRLSRRHHPPRHGALPSALAENDLDAKLLLQVHDELVLEVKTRKQSRSAMWPRA